MLTHIGSLLTFMFSLADMISHVGTTDVCPVCLFVLNMLPLLYMISFSHFFNPSSLGDTLRVSHNAVCHSSRNEMNMN